MKKIHYAVLSLMFSASSFATVHTVKIVGGMKFEPADVNIVLGDTVEFVNTTAFNHTATADKSRAKNPNNVILPAGAEPFHSGVLAQNQTFSHVFNVEGDYQYVCLPHELMGMMGRVHVSK